MFVFYMFEKDNAKKATPIRYFIRELCKQRTRMLQ